MGYRHYFYVFPSKAYFKLIRPKLIQYYGPLNRYKILREEKKKMYWAARFNADWLRSMKKNEVNGETLMQRFFESKQSSEYKESYNSKLYEKIDNLYSKHQIYYIQGGNHFLRNDDYMSCIDEFDQSIKVLNMTQLENFLKYIEIVKKVYGEKGKDQINTGEYAGVGYTKQIFDKVLKLMKNTKEQTVFLLYYCG